MSRSKPWNVAVATYGAAEMKNALGAAFELDPAWKAGMVSELGRMALGDQTSLALGAGLLSLAAFGDVSGAEVVSGGPYAGLELADLAGELASYQIPNSGAFTWNAGSYPGEPDHLYLDFDDAAVQQTAYAVLGLVAAQRAGLVAAGDVDAVDAAIARGRDWLIGFQNMNGGWMTGFDSAMEYAEIDAEVLWAIFEATQP